MSTAVLRRTGWDTMSPRTIQSIRLAGWPIKDTTRIADKSKSMRRNRRTPVHGFAALLVQVASDKVRLEILERYLREFQKETPPYGHP